MKTTLNKIIRVTFRRPDGKIVMIVANNTFSANAFTVKFRGETASFRLVPGAVGTYIWSGNKF